MRSKCPFRNEVCSSCNKTGHISKVCHLKRNNRSANHLSVVSQELPVDQIDSVICLKKVYTNTSIDITKPMIPILIDGIQVEM